MSRAARSRGPLPRRVYWARRFVVLVLVPVLAVALVLGIARLLDGGSGGEREAAVAVRSEPDPASAGATEQPSPGGEASPAPGASGERGKKQESRRLALPGGPCAPDDVVVTPRPVQPHAGDPVTFVLELTTERAAACTFAVDAESVFLRISTEERPVWSSQDCPSPVPATTVVPRREQAAVVRLTWNGRESDEACSDATPYVLAGSYIASAVALGSDSPVDVGFVLMPAVAPTITKTRKPKPTPSASPTDRARRSDRPGPRD